MASNKATFLIMSTKDMPFNAGLVMKEMLAPFGGRGGGSKTYAQGTAPAEHHNAVIDRFKQIVGVQDANR